MTSKTTNNCPVLSVPNSEILLKDRLKKINVNKQKYLIIFLLFLRSKFSIKKKLKKIIKYTVVKCKAK